MVVDLPLAMATASTAVGTVDVADEVESGEIVSLGWSRSFDFNSQDLG